MQRELLISLSIFILSNANALGDKYQLCADRYIKKSGDIDGYDRCLRNSQEQKKLEKLSSDPSFTKKESDLSVDTLCTNRYAQDVRGYTACKKSFAACAKDPFKTPENPKDMRAQTNCINAHEKEIATQEQIYDTSRNRELIEKQSATNNEMLQLQKQELQIQRQQQNLQIFNAVQKAFPINNTKPLTPFYVPTRIPSRTNCYSDGTGGVNCTTY